MRRRLALALLLAAPALLSAADPLVAARAEAAAAAREQQRLDGLIAATSGTQARLRAEQDAAAQGIVAAEAQLALLKFEAISAERQLVGVRTRLDAEQRPAALLLAGLAQYGRRPPLLSLAAGGSAADIVHLRALIDATLPAVEARTAGLRQQLDASRALAAEADTARQAALRQQGELHARQQRFALLEGQLNRRLAALGGAALGASDVALAELASADTAAGRALADQQARRTAADLARFEPAPQSPFGGTGAPAPALLAWRLPLDGAILGGLGEVSPSGVRSRGLTIAARAGAPVAMPAAGTIVFAGPFRSHLSVIVLDHGGGWLTLLTEVRTTLTPGTRLAPGEPLGRALGNVTVELSRNGQPQPAALIAGSSPLLSKGG
ncbi:MULTISPECIES: murein hydrolase activator EnvC family protein [Sphingomonas]|uniref:murein hydrolase activator EnvC family protein n=1 Tax=Sphingomonas TaxID=13687 RepID=UPI000DEF4AF6|nr:MULTISPECIES: peptidoglycan DD-metalloendopeptidase family protein [Sphingomonas]